MIIYNHVNLIVYLIVHLEGGGQNFFKKWPHGLRTTSNKQIKKRPPIKKFLEYSSQMLLQHHFSILPCNVDTSSHNLFSISNKHMYIYFFLWSTQSCIWHLFMRMFYNTKVNIFFWIPNSCSNWDISKFKPPCFYWHIRKFQYIFHVIIQVLIVLTQLQSQMLL